MRLIVIMVMAFSLSGCVAVAAVAIVQANNAAQDKREKEAAAQAAPKTAADKKELGLEKKRPDAARPPSAAPGPAG